MIYVYEIVAYEVYDFFSIQMIFAIVLLFVNTLSLSC